jgi:hypothetical protein
MADYIYGLVCPVASVVRYIGKSDDPDRRYKAHLGTAHRDHSHKARWIAKIGRSGLVPDLIVIREVAEGEDWAAVEREEIAKGWAAGLPLTNMTIGGEGARLNEAGLAAKAAAMGRPETRAKMSASARARWADPELGKIGRAQNGAPDRRAKLSEGAKRRATPEYRAAQAERSRAAWADKDKRSRIVAGITDETKAMVSAASKAAWANSPRMAKCRANLKPATAEVLEKARTAKANPEFKAKMRAIFDSPAYREKLSQALKASWERRRKG